MAVPWAAHEEDGQWKGEGLAESQDWGQYDHGVYAPWAPAVWAGHGAAPIGHDGRVVDTPEVAKAKAAHFAAKAAAAHGAPWAPTPVAPWGPAPWGAPWAPAVPGVWAGHVQLTPDGKYLKDTPEVAHAKAAHLAAKAAAVHGPGWW